MKNRADRNKYVTYNMGTSTSNIFVTKKKGEIIIGSRQLNWANSKHFEDDFV